LLLGIGADSFAAADSHGDRGRGGACPGGLSRHEIRLTCRLVTMRRGDLLLILGLVALAIALAEMQVRQAATSRWLGLAILWVIGSGILIWLAYG
jgi:hypothetical protein